MKIFKDPKKIQQHISNLKKRGKTVAFVPTMGALHEGHAALLRKARTAGDILVLSIFVNPLQFGPAEDFSRYPRPLKNDLAVAKKEKVDMVFTPAAADLYAADHSTHVAEDDLSRGLCGAVRPGHFRVVTTVVAKLFNIVLPDSAFFGQKDYQQYKVIERMSRDLRFPVRLVMVPTAREKDGLAMSSRNTYLSTAERETAPAIYQALCAAKKDIEEGAALNRAGSRIRAALRKSGIRAIDYAAVLSAADLKAASQTDKKLVVAVAVRLGKTRLIDNILVKRSGKNI